MPAPTERPYGGWFDELADEIELALADRNLPVSSVIDKVVVDRDEITFFVLAEYIVDFARMLRDEPGLRFEMCLGVNGVHYPEDKGTGIARRLSVLVYNAQSPTPRRSDRSRCKPRTSPRSSASTRRTIGTSARRGDFFGIVFDDHPSLTRIEMPDDWAGHPQAQGLPARWHTGRVQGRHDSRSG